MSAIKEDIARINDEYFLENKRLREQTEIDEQIILNLGKRLKSADEKIERLEAEIREYKSRLGEPHSPR